MLGLARLGVVARRLVAASLTEVIRRIRPLLHRFPLLMVLFPVLSNLSGRSLIDLNRCGSLLGGSLDLGSLLGYDLLGYDLLGSRGIRTLILSGVSGGWRR